MRKFLAFLAGGALAVMGEANAQAIPDLPAATLPLSGNEVTVLVQGGATVQASISAFPTAAVPPIPLTLSSAPLTAPSFLDTPGSTSWYGQSGQLARWQLVMGSNASPITAAGPGLAIGYTGAVTNDKCNNNAASTGCNSALMVNATGTIDTTMVTSGITTYAQGLANEDVQAINAVGYVGGTSTSIGLGAYLQGIRGTATGTGRGVGAEISSWTQATADNCTVTTSGVGGISNCDGAWIVPRSNTGGYHLSSALHIGQADTSVWKEGLTINTSSVSDTAINIKGGATNALAITSGNISLGTGTITSTGSLTVGGASSTPSIKAHSTRAFDALMEMDNAGGGNQSAILFADAGVLKWSCGKQTDNSFYCLDSAHAAAFLLVGTGGNVTLGETGKIVTLIGDTWTNGKLLRSATAPTIASGGCTTGSAQSVSQSNGTAAFAITLGGATCGSAIVLTMPIANAGWVCDAHDVTTPASNVVEQSTGNTISVTLTNYVRTTGVAGNFTGADVLAVKCLAY